MTGEHRGPRADPAPDAPSAALTRAILPSQSTLTVGRIVAYLGFRREGLRYAGTYQVRDFDPCFSVSCGTSCDRFLYYLEPLDPAACGLDPGFGIATHGVAALTPADQPPTSRTLS
ncbi:MAG: hypothetical protein HOV83_41960 [Catenulispora sp.]|nr:hypothetical protein [Catenulispora sp.]